MEISVAQAARTLGVSEEAVRSRLRNGELHGRRVRIGERDRWMVDAEAVAAWQVRRSHMTAPARTGTVPSSLPTPPQAPPVWALPGTASPRREDVLRPNAEAEVVRLRQEVQVLRSVLRELLALPS